MNLKNKNPSIKILVGYHKPAVLLKDEILTPIHLGRVLATQASKDGEISKEDYEWMCENMIGDDTGDNISHLNRYFCELTGIYWAWKNYNKLGNPDYIGFMHYRRQFVFDEGIADRFENSIYYYKYEKIDEYLKQLIDINKIDISLYDIISPKALKIKEHSKRKYETVPEFLFSFCSGTKFYALIELMKNDEKLQKYRHLALNLSNQGSFFPCNMFIMKKDLFFEYCEFLFYTMFKLYDRFKQKLSNTNSSSKRELSWISEYITSTFIKKQIEHGKKSKEVCLSYIIKTDSLTLKKDLLRAKIKDEIKQADIVSFDIFDTLLLRTYLKPSDLFEHLEQNFNAKNFAYARSIAERKAMKELNKTQASFDDIYNFLPKKFHFLKDKERELEYKNIYANKFMKELFEYALSLNKKVFLISDMYYDEQFISSLLEKCDIKGYDKLYVSSTYNLNKRSGSLFEYIFDKIDVDRDKILHIGDNELSDYKTPSKYGIKALCVPMPSSLFFEEYKLLKDFYEANTNLTSSIILALLVKKTVFDEDIDYYKYLGYFIGGAFIFAISNFVFENIIKNGLKDIFFIARDGYMIKEVFELILKKRNIKDINSSYIVASRAFNLLINPDLSKLKINDRQQKIHSLFHLLCEQNEKFNDLYKNISDAEEKYNILLNEKDLIKEISNKNKELYKHYLSQFDFKAQNIAIFDGNASTFSSLKLLKSMFKDKNFFPLYYNVGGDDEIKKKINFNAYENGYVKIINYPFSEFLMSAPHFSKSYINEDKEFVENNNDFEELYKEIFSLIYKHELDFAEDLLDSFADFKVSFDNQIIASYINFFLVNMGKRDEFYLKDVYIGVDSAHSLHLKIIRYNENMYAPALGATYRMKDQLSYRLGTILLKSNNVKSLFACPFKLLKELVSFKTREYILKLLRHKTPPLYTYKDYNEALKIKKHLTYRLGNLLVKHPFTFLFRASKVYKEWNREKGRYI